MVLFASPGINRTTTLQNGIFLQNHWHEGESLLGTFPLYQHDLNMTIRMKHEAIHLVSRLFLFGVKTQISMTEHNCVATAVTNDSWTNSLTLTTITSECALSKCLSQRVVSIACLRQEFK